MIFIKLNTKTKINLIIQCVGMLTGTATHLLWIINNGFLSEKYNAPVLSTFFWDSLTFLDPIAAILLILKPKTGIWVVAVIVVVDVLHNGNICFRALLSEPQSFTNWIKNNWMLWTQVFFGLFVIISFKNNWEELKFKNTHTG
ncbi:hypothetical protein [Mucilaginibacter paludis]|uniref:Uncharacterized protein n=1 Tax=Mucilaginibacter paludis DSM 18603 TaxID=714943 RepID=H1Y8N4_9SPHI|nr:hypothetical protein [Mucilaginibacter paludis]EHQ26906.1 hypothetical protein Mucpa_2795 [Mucilaginibacter paludis DSM 18603]